MAAPLRQPSDGETPHFIPCLWRAADTTTRWLAAACLQATLCIPWIFAQPELVLSVAPNLKHCPAWAVKPNPNVMDIVDVHYRDILLADFIAQFLAQDLRDLMSVHPGNPFSRKIRYYPTHAKREKASTCAVAAPAGAPCQGRWQPPLMRPRPRWAS